MSLQVNIAECRRVVLFHYDKENHTFEVRHYLITVAPTGVSRSVKRLLQSRIPSLGNLDDIAEYVLKYVLNCCALCVHYVCTLCALYSVELLVVLVLGLAISATHTPHTCSATLRPQRATPKTHQRLTLSYLITTLVMRNLLLHRNPRKVQYVCWSWGRA